MRSCIFFLSFVTMASGQTCRPDQVRTSTVCCNGALGSLYAEVRIRNNSEKSCLLQGVPKIKALDESGKPLPVTVRGNEDLTAHGKGSNRFVLQPGGEARLNVQTEEPNYDQNRCGRQLVLDINGVIVTLQMLSCGPPQQPLRVFTSGFYPAPVAK